MSINAVTADLIIGWSNQTLSEDEVQQLETLLQDNSAARIAFARACLDDVALVQNLQISKDAKTVSGLQAAIPSNRKRRGKRKRKSHNQIQQHMVIWAGAAIAALLLLYIGIGDSTPNVANHASDNPHSAKQGHSFAAHLVEGTIYQKDTHLQNIPFNTTVHNNEAPSLIQLTELNARIRISAHSTFYIKKNGHVHLSQGSLHFDVDPLPQGKQLSAHGSFTYAQVVGTQFSLTQNPRETIVSVKEGTVRSRNQAGQSVLLHAGDSLQVQAQTTMQGTSAEHNPFSPYQLNLVTKDAKSPINTDTITISAQTQFNILVEDSSAQKMESINGQIDGIDMALGGQRNAQGFIIEQEAPFHLFGDNNAVPQLRKLEKGTHTIVITFYSDNLGQHVIDRKTLTVNVE